MNQVEEQDVHKWETTELVSLSSSYWGSHILLILQQLKDFKSRLAKKKFHLELQPLKNPEVTYGLSEGNLYILLQTLDQKFQHRNKDGAGHDTNLSSFNDLSEILHMSEDEDPKGRSQQLGGRHKWIDKTLALPLDDFTLKALMISRQEIRMTLVPAIITKIVKEHKDYLAVS